jgi:CheY-like chemotaxis protein
VNFVSNPSVSWCSQLLNGRDLLLTKGVCFNLHEVAVMAHEIRTPLHQVVGFIELLATSGLNAEQTESVDMLQSSAHALMAIINDLLDFTKLEAGKMKLEIIPFQVRGVLDGSVAAIQPQVHEKGLTVKCVVDQQIPIKLLGDPNRLRQIVLNMLTNAVKFTKRGEIVVESKRVKKEDGRISVRFSVKDSGIGIPKDKCDRIFNPYQQADASVSRNYGGTGLGLAICKSLVDSMAGQIGVESELGKGATFWFEIPFGMITKCHQQDSTDLDAASLHEAFSLRILVAEDNKVNQKVVCKMLSRLGHETVVAENGQEAVACIAKSQDTKFDMILMDWQMPVMDGIDATKEIRRRGFSVSELPIVGLTASIQGLDWSEIGMNDCLTKPIRIADLKSALQKNMR